MRNKLSKFTENLIRLAALERVHQLEEISDNINVIDKQIEFTEIADEIILRANKAPKGLIEVVFSNGRNKREAKIEDILLNSESKISGFNVSNPTEIRSMFRTVIIVDHMWSSNLEVYQSEYGLDDSYLN